VALLTLVGTVGLVAAPAAKAADTLQAQCEAAYEGAQLMRQRGKLVTAREQAALCARDVCPEVARRDCAKWAEELGREVPTVVVVARDEADRDVPALRLLVDGVPRAELASGRAFELDPGAHVFRIERPNAPPVEQSFTVYQSERDRLLRITVPVGASVLPPRPVVPSVPAPTSTSTATATPYVAPSPPPPPGEPAPDRGSLVPAVVVGGISVVAFVTSGYLGWTGRQQLSDLRSSGGCAPNCTDAQVNPVRTRLTASDWALGVGLVGAAAAVSLFVLRGSF
jgi:hypothetical protein